MDHACCGFINDYVFILSWKCRNPKVADIISSYSCCLIRIYTEVRVRTKQKCTSRVGYEIMNCLSCAVPLCVKMSKGIKGPNFQLYELRSVVLMGYVNGNLFVDNLARVN